MQSIHPTVPQIRRRPAVEQRTGLSRAGIYKAMAEGTFPLPVKLTAKAVGWHDHQIDEWINSRPVAGAAGKP